MGIDVRDASGRPIPEAKGQDIKDEISYREIIDTFPDDAKKPTKARVHIDKWEKEKGTVGFGNPGVRDRIVGREIIIEKRHGFYDIRAADNDPINHELRMFIDKRYSDLYEGFNILDFLPGKPTRTYVSWDIPVKRLVSAMGQAANFPFDAKKSTGKGQLTGVFDKDGRKYGRIELTANIVPDFPGKDVAMQEAKIDLKWTVELCIDGSRHDVKATANIDVVMAFSHAREGSGRVTAKGVVVIAETEEKIGKAAKPAPRKSEGKVTEDWGKAVPAEEWATKSDEGSKVEAPPPPRPKP
jgi:hypothetical protein